MSEVGGRKGVEERARCDRGLIERARSTTTVVATAWVVCPRGVTDVKKRDVGSALPARRGVVNRRAMLNNAVVVAQRRVANVRKRDVGNELSAWGGVGYQWKTSH